MVLSSELTQNAEEEQQERQLRHRNIVHLWQFLLQLLRTNSCREIISWSRKEHREFKLHNPEEVARRWGIFKRNKAMTYQKLSRALRYYYQQGIIRKVPGQKFVYRLNKRALKCEADGSRSTQLKPAPRAITSSSFEDSFHPSTTPLRKLWYPPDMPMPYCPRCLCPSFSPITPPSFLVREKIIFQPTFSSPNKPVLPVTPFSSLTSIPVSVIQWTTGNVN